MGPACLQVVVNVPAGILDGHVAYNSDSQMDLVELAVQLVFGSSGSGSFYEMFRKYDHYVIQDPLATIGLSLDSRFGCRTRLRATP